MTEEQICKSYKTDCINGLSEHDVRSRQKKYGYNILPEKGVDAGFKIFIRQFQSPLIYILLVAALIIFFVGPDSADAFIITGILLFNALIGAIQEGRTSRILASLKKFIVSDCVVVRNGISLVINAEQLVPGDIVLLQEGQRVPADMRLVVSHNLHVDESILTGESLQVSKQSASLSTSTLITIMEQSNMLFKGTYVLTGSCKGVVVAIGTETEVGKIHLSAQEVQAEIPLKKELNTLSVYILIFVLSVCFILFIAGLVTGKPFKELLVTLTALFICVVPEGLPVVLTLVLVSGVYRMAKLRVLVKRMQAVETLGRTDVIVIDKTGTLTRNEMMVSNVWVDNKLLSVTGQGYFPLGDIYIEDQKVTQDDLHKNSQMLGKACLMLSNAQITVDDSGRFAVKGDPTEAAMAVFGQKIGFSKAMLEKEYIKIGEIPFDSRLKYHAITCSYDGQGIIFVSGAPETLFSWYRERPEGMQEALAQFLSYGLRVVAIGYKKVDLETLEKILSQREQIEELISHDIIQLGLIGIQDAIRQEVAGAIDDTRNAGLRIIMATGDHQKTALYVAKQVGIFREGDKALEGKNMDMMAPDALKKIVPSVTVYSRVSPAHKLKLIQLLHEQGHIVAMTGDGVNDVPSLVAADIGIAMGTVGTEVAKEVADIVLLDDSFVHIVTAIKQGRHIFYTLRRVILYFFATNMGEVLIMLFAMGYLFVNPTFPLPLAAAQILWLNLITDGFLDMALSMEPYEKGLLDKEMITNKLHLVDGSILKKTLWMALPMAIGSLGIFMHYYRINIAFARTMALMSMAMFQWFNAWNCRSEKQSIFALGILSNPWLIAATIFVLLLQLSIIYVPGLQAIFKTVPLSIHDWIIICSVSSSIILCEELRKLFVRYQIKNGTTLTKG
jgi:Ca2+-transporting ATPase